MKTVLLYLLGLLFLLLSISCGDGDKDDDPGKGEEEFVLQEFDPKAVSKSNPMKLYVHYMPWFETKESNQGSWGQHWTMGNKNPDNIDSNGKREIAAHYYPLIGPYASGDPHVIEYHLLLIKYAGIDGLLIDWYGVRDLWDYPANKRNTEALVKALDKVGLGFAIVYEDQTLREGLDANGKVSQAKADMQYLETNFFGKSNYIRVDGKPLLLVFGPQELKTPAEWTSVFSILKTKPTFLTLYAHSGASNNATDKNAAGEYIWVDATSMEKKYASKNSFDVFIGGAYPGFNAFYDEGGWGSDPLSPINHESGALFKRLLDMAKTENMDYLQLITWNDFGEGTMIEPTQEFGYTFLTGLQQFAGIPYNEANLKGIHTLYELRKKSGTDQLTKDKISQVFYYLVSLQTDKATQLINSLTNE
ncbi:hypothetical protein M2459_001323 [Parabacteroides sp. PF5-5]|uniref:glycoside hydrolase family 71/99-like protein n=1 Tax=unclassified Parabacteroides TaxID=2649774 RepID=UPI002475F764|nr:MULTISPECIES: glycoside hydrolase family 71/99-like protein [unclassified Parabacteroides]MDH6304588.1 hypothetical protein [Parabacteroides sp. PH5-39]MDH6315799.1 hypothetical protein [Parabacteroides sp. PF5-13]MDH6319458.1 hypothetical protein [Parabacteroides sp. PH5-13]MDH6323189.1 hypothetical protein [Parabacteroides sp. PH5-8]MDH6326991.1 hypothetical protein [Parabacteroides sp. PH5-41]